MNLKLKTQKDQSTSGSYLDVLQSIDAGRKVRTQLYEERDDSNFAIINFPHICSNISVSPINSVCISHTK
jgi:hypothetical protein